MIFVQRVCSVDVWGHCDGCRCLNECWNKHTNPRVATLLGVKENIIWNSYVVRQNKHSNDRDRCA